MSARHRQSSGRSIGTLGVALTAVFGLIASSLLLSAPADAATTARAQLTATGVATGTSPTGGTVVGVHPGDSVRFAGRLAPTAGVPAGLGGLVDGLLNVAGSVRVVANFSALPGGRANTVLQGSTTKQFSFPRLGRYNFTYKLQRVTVKLIDLGGLLGGTKRQTTITDINLDGNQLRKAGVKLNASNQYIGTVVVARRPPQGGISVQLPKVKVAPSAPVVGQLPTVTVPRVSVPTVTVPKVKVPKVKIPKLTLPKVPTGNNSGGGSSSPSSKSGLNYTPPGPTIPEQVVPQNPGDQLYVGSNGGSGVSGITTDPAGGGGGFNGLLPDGGSNAGSLQTGRVSVTDTTPAAAPVGKENTVDLAADPGSPSSQLPVLLAILAIIVLAVVAGTYARLFLLKRSSD